MTPKRRFTFTRVFGGSGALRSFTSFHGPARESQGLWHLRSSLSGSFVRKPKKLETNSSRPDATSRRAPYFPPIEV